MSLTKNVLPDDPEHLKLAFSFLGMREGSGASNNPKVLEFYKDAGNAWVKKDSVAWCAAFVGAMLARSGLPHTSSLAARSYQDWGKKTTKPKRGDVVVISRGRSAWQGHVFFFLDEIDGRIWGIGGNQRGGDGAVTVASYPKSRLLNYRTPVTLRNSRTIKALAVASVGASVMGSVEQVQTFSASISKAGDVFKTLSEVSPYFLVLGGCITAFGILWAGYARYTDWMDKAR